MPAGAALKPKVIACSALNTEGDGCGNASNTCPCQQAQPEPFLVSLFFLHSFFFFSFFTFFIFLFSLGISNDMMA